MSTVLGGTRSPTCVLVVILQLGSAQSFLLPAILLSPPVTSCSPPGNAAGWENRSPRLIPLLLIHCIRPTVRWIQWTVHVSRMRATFLLRAVGVSKE